MTCSDSLNNPDRYASTCYSIQPKQVEHVIPSEADIEAIEAAPLTEAIGDSHQSGHAVVTSQPNVITTTEVLDKCQHKHSPIIMPTVECADQSEPAPAPRQVGVGELERGRGTESIDLVETILMHPEAARSRTNAHFGGLVSETVKFPPIDDQICDVNREGMFPVHVAYDSTNHTSHILNSLGSNEQDDGSDHEGSPGLIEEVLSESATRNRSVSARFGTSGGQALSEATEGSMGVVPCTPLMSQNQGSQGDSHGAQKPRRVQQSLLEQMNCNYPVPDIPQRGSPGEQS